MAALVGAISAQPVGGDKPCPYDSAGYLRIRWYLRADEDIGPYTVRWDFGIGLVGVDL